MFSAIGEIEEDAVALAILAEIDDPLADRGEIVALPDLLAVAIDTAGAAIRQAADRLHRLGTPRADQPAQAHDFARAHLEADIVNDAPVRSPDHLQDRLALAFSPRLLADRGRAEPARPSSPPPLPGRRHRLSVSTKRRRAAR